MEDITQNKFTLFDDECLIEHVVKKTKILEYSLRPPMHDVNIEAYWDGITKKFNEGQNYSGKVFYKAELKARWEILLKYIKTKGGILKDLNISGKMRALMTQVTKTLGMHITKSPQSLPDPASSSSSPTPLREVVPPTATEIFIHSKMPYVQALAWKERALLLAELVETTLQKELENVPEANKLINPICENIMAECDSFFKKVNVTEEVPINDKNEVLNNMTSTFINRINKSLYENGVTNTNKNNFISNGAENLIPASIIPNTNNIFAQELPVATFVTNDANAPDADVIEEGTKSPLPLLITDVRSLREDVNFINGIPNDRQQSVPNLLITNVRSLRQDVQDNVAPPPLLIRNVGNIRTEQLRAIRNVGPLTKPPLTPIPVKKLVATTNEFVNNNNNTGIKHIVMKALSPINVMKTENPEPMELGIDGIDTTVTAPNKEQKQTPSSGCIVLSVESGAAVVKDKIITPELVNEKKTYIASNAVNKHIIPAELQNNKIIGASPNDKSQKRNSGLLLPGDDDNVPALAPTSNVIDQEVENAVNKIQIETPQSSKRSLRSDTKNLSIKEDSVKATTTFAADDEMIKKRKYIPYIPMYRTRRSCRSANLSKFVPLHMAAQSVRKFHIRIKRDFKDHKPLRMTRSKAKQMLGA